MDVTFTLREKVGCKYNKINYGAQERHLYKLNTIHSKIS